MQAEDPLNLVQETRPLFAAEPSHLALPADRPIVFVGDLRGDATTAAAIIERFAGTHRLVFLGDFLDRAPTTGGSVEIIALLLQAKLAAPECVHLLRRNHELRRVFRDERFGDGLLDLGDARQESAPIRPDCLRSARLIAFGPPIVEDALAVRRPVWCVKQPGAAVSSWRKRVSHYVAARSVAGVTRENA